MLLLFFPSAVAAFSFLTVGDWGGEALEEPSKPYHQNVLNVAKAMETAMSHYGASFVVNTGDNFYWCGIGNTSDFQIKTDWVEPFQSKKALQVPWYSILGNHEYGYNFSAQFQITKQYKNWIMDDHHYSKRIELGTSHYATFIFLDTSPCVSEYRSAEPKGWDPCGTEYPTCSLSGGPDQFEGPCRFHQNIMSIECKPQFTWLQKTLADAPKEDWLIVVGHHGADEIDEEDFTTAMQQRGVDLYINGHEHALTHYLVDNAGAYITSGAGSLVMSKDQLGGTPLRDRSFQKVNNLELEQMETVPYGLGHTYKPVFHQAVTGFTAHKFSTDFKTLTSDLLDTSGTVLHSFAVTKK